MPQYLHFSLGPVQSFVAQARRTRDFWAGSFLLSWLSAVAMKTVEKVGGRILFPAADPEMMAWLEGKGSGAGPRQANVPNRFKAEVPDGFDAALVPRAVHQAWAALAEKVWEADLEGRCGPAQREIWDRQIQSFWEIQWALTDDPADTSILDRRKAWRSHLPPGEPGAKCMVLDGYQELSAVATPKDSSGLRAFWQGLWKEFEGWRQDLDEDEQLSALAFLKRRFAHRYASLKEPMPGGWTLRGWKLEPAVPSVAHLCAAHWLARVIATEPTEKLERLRSAASRAGAKSGERNNLLHCLVEACEARQEGKEPGQALAGLDSEYFFRSNLENRLHFPDPTAVAPLLAALGSLSIAEPPSPFYAVLVMDGDQLGHNLGYPDRQEGLTRALAEFTRAVPQMVRLHNGFLIYAGGDDVLALLPVEDALGCAAELRKVYLEAFAGTSATSTLSGAVVFPHLHRPLNRVLADAHELLDAVAKDGCGRDALAVQILKPGGVTAQWALPWELALGADGRLVVEALADGLREQDQAAPGFSHRLLHRLREVLPWLTLSEEASESTFTLDQAAELLAAEFLSSGRNSGLSLSREGAVETVRPLLEQCSPRRRTASPEGRTESFSHHGAVEEGGALLVRFLAQKGVER